MFHYPLTSRRSVLDCPVHEFTVAIGADGRIASRCPGCVAEARRARRRLRTLAKRALAVA